MDVREKLVELLNDMQRSGIGYFGSAIENKKVANYLIKHGVTVQECGYWVSLTDCSNAGVYCSVCHKKVYKEDYAWCNRKNKLRYDYCPHCGAKIMSEPPRGE